MIWLSGFVIALGWRTSGEILSLQMGAFRANTAQDYIYMDAPHPATGPPDPAIAVYYKDRPYFEWTTLLSPGEVDATTVSVSLDVVLEELRVGDYDGMLGFSQGAAMCTRVLHAVENNPSLLPARAVPRAVILISGVPPGEYIGQADKVRPVVLVPLLNLLLGYCYV